MTTFALTGFVETDDGLERFEIRRGEDGGYDVWTNDDLRDDLDDVCGFIEEVGGVYYASKAAYKRDEALDLSLAILRDALGTARRDAG